VPGTVLDSGNRDNAEQRYCLLEAPPRAGEIDSGTHMCQKVFKALCRCVKCCTPHREKVGRPPG
jgi:hypothetical protein